MSAPGESPPPGPPRSRSVSVLSVDRAPLHRRGLSGQQDSSAGMDTLPESAPPGAGGRPRRSQSRPPPSSNSASSSSGSLAASSRRERPPGSPRPPSAGPPTSRGAGRPEQPSAGRRRARASGRMRIDDGHLIDGHEALQEIRLVENDVRREHDADVRASATTSRNDARGRSDRRPSPLCEPLDWNELGRCERAPLLKAPPQGGISGFEAAMKLAATLEADLQKHLDRSPKKSELLFFFLRTPSVIFSLCVVLCLLLPAAVIHLHRSSTWQAGLGGAAGFSATTGPLVPWVPLFEVALVLVLIAAWISSAIWWTRLRWREPFRKASEFVRVLRMEATLRGGIALEKVDIAPEHIALHETVAVVRPSLRSDRSEYFTAKGSRRSTTARPSAVAQVPLSLLAPGDLVRLAPGDSAPCNLRLVPAPGEEGGPPIAATGSRPGPRSTRATYSSVAAAAVVAPSVRAAAPPRRHLVAGELTASAPSGAAFVYGLVLDDPTLPARRLLQRSLDLVADSNIGQLLPRSEAMTAGSPRGRTNLLSKNSQPASSSMAPGYGGISAQLTSLGHPSVRVALLELSLAVHGSFLFLLVATAACVALVLILPDARFHWPAQMVHCSSIAIGLLLISAAINPATRALSHLAATASLVARTRALHRRVLTAHHPYRDWARQLLAEEHDIPGARARSPQPAPLISRLLDRLAGLSSPRTYSRDYLGWIATGTGNKSNAVPLYYQQSDSPESATGGSSSSSSSSRAFADHSEVDVPLSEILRVWWGLLTGRDAEPVFFTRFGTLFPALMSRAFLPHFPTWDNSSARSGSSASSATGGGILGSLCLGRRAESRRRPRRMLEEVGICPVTALATMDVFCTLGREGLLSEPLPQAFEVSFVSPGGELVQIPIGRTLEPLKCPTSHSASASCSYSVQSVHGLFLDLSNWEQYLGSLKPLGFNFLLNNNPFSELDRASSHAPGCPSYGRLCGVCQTYFSTRTGHPEPGASIPADTCTCVAPVAWASSGVGWDPSELPIKDLCSVCNVYASSPVRKGSRQPPRFTGGPTSCFSVANLHALATDMLPSPGMSFPAEDGTASPPSGESSSKPFPDLHILQRVWLSSFGRLSLARRLSLAPIAQTMGFNADDVRSAFSPVRSIYTVPWAPGSRAPVSIPATGLAVGVGTFMASMVSTILAPSEGSSGYQLLSEGTPELVLSYCTHYWDGTEVVPFNQEVLKQLREYVRDARGRDCLVVAYSYRPLIISPKSPIIGLRTESSKSRGRVHFSSKPGEALPPIVLPVRMPEKIDYMHAPSTVSEDHGAGVHSNTRDWAAMSGGASDWDAQPGDGSPAPIISNISTALARQIFCGFSIIGDVARPHAPPLIDALSTAGVRAVFLSGRGARAAKAFAVRLGLPTDWNCCISLADPRPAGGLHSHLQHMEQSPPSSDPSLLESTAAAMADMNTDGTVDGLFNFVEDGDDTMALEKSQLPRGISAIRPHLRRVDDVPLLVQIFARARGSLPPISHAVARQMSTRAPGPSSAAAAALAAADATAAAAGRRPMRHGPGRRNRPSRATSLAGSRASSVGSGIRAPRSLAIALGRPGVQSEMISIYAENGRIVCAAGAAARSANLDGFAQAHVAIGLDATPLASLLLRWQLRHLGTLRRGGRSDSGAGASFDEDQEELFEEEDEEEEDLEEGPAGGSASATAPSNASSPLATGGPVGSCDPLLLPVGGREGDRASGHGEGSDDEEPGLGPASALLHGDLPLPYVDPHAISSIISSLPCSVTLPMSRAHSPLDVLAVLRSARRLHSVLWSGAILSLLGAWAAASASLLPELAGLPPAFGLSHLLWIACVVIPLFGFLSLGAGSRAAGSGWSPAHSPPVPGLAASFRRDPASWTTDWSKSLLHEFPVFTSCPLRRLSRLVKLALSRLAPAVVAVPFTFYLALAAFLDITPLYDIRSVVRAVWSDTLAIPGDSSSGAQFPSGIPWRVWAAQQCALVAFVYLFALSSLALRHPWKSIFGSPGSGRTRWWAITSLVGILLSAIGLLFPAIFAPGQLQAELSLAVLYGRFNLIAAVAVPLVLTPLALLMPEWTKRSERRDATRAQKRAQLHFWTRLGMHSPV
ncbi:hypothetical protein H696_01706 [Fonticula alba]|uniref:Uncharacterized protein n=1 Tax=Fonticula alba TaxID=691883 RepID=A0A058ZD24_FONAL|nr:hypothetical protein H696_01706 [Fonticula alba]KCV72310.1 hypothetical protein H696_01706 [Fonticula alba]|eukprot:XP_009493888.1 hypothetical protein H696_01706 [Fonticula alba]